MTDHETHGCTGRHAGQTGQVSPSEIKNEEDGCAGRTCAENGQAGPEHDRVTTQGKADNGAVTCDCGKNKEADTAQAAAGAKDAKAGNEQGENCETAQVNGENADADGEENPFDTIARLGDDLALARADLYNLNREYTNYVRRAKEAAGEHNERGRIAVLEALIPVLDDIQAARDAGDLQEGPFASIADKLERILTTTFNMERFGAAGDEFDPMLHEAVMAQEKEGVETACIGQVFQPGYKKGDRVLRPTKVLVHNPQ